MKANQEWVKELEIMVATRVRRIPTKAVCVVSSAHVRCRAVVLGPTPTKRPGVMPLALADVAFACAAQGEGRDSGPELLRVPVPQPGVPAAEAAGRRLDLI